MKKSVMLKMVRQQIRRALNPTGLMGKRGPAKSVPVLVRRHVEAARKPHMHDCFADFGLGLSE